jgi:hypothetical protein
MTKWIIIVVLAAGGWYWWMGRTPKAGTPPTAVQAEAAVREHLLAARPCSGGRVDIPRLENVRVQNWNPELRAWPVLADFSVECERGQVVSTWNSGGGGAFTCFITTQAGAYRCGVPAALGRAASEMNESIRKSMEESLQKLGK